MQKKVNRTAFVALGAAYMALSGVLYAWTNFSGIISEETGWSFTGLSLVFTIWSLGTAAGSILSGFLMRRFRAQRIMIFGALTGALAITASTFLTGSIAAFYVVFGIISGVAMGTLGVPVQSTVVSWYPENVGRVSGIMMVGLGVGTLLLGYLGSALAGAVGWRWFFRIYALLVLTLQCICAAVIKTPELGQVPEKKLTEEKVSAGFGRDYSTGEMLKRSSFWMFFLWTAFGYMGNVIVSAHANQMAQQLGTGVTIAAMSVGFHHIFCALGSFSFGVIYDRFGTRKTLFLTNVLLLGGALCFVAAAAAGSQVFFIAGLVILGLGTGAIPPIASAHGMLFYGKKYYPSNYSVLGLRIVIGSLGSYLAAAIYESSGGYMMVYIAMSAALALFFIVSSFIRKP